MAGTTVRSPDEQLRAITAAFARGDIPAGVIGVVSAALLVMPVAGLSYILLSLGKNGLLAAIETCRLYTRPVRHRPAPPG